MIVLIPVALLVVLVVVVCVLYWPKEKPAQEKPAPDGARTPVPEPIDVSVECARLGLSVATCTTISASAAMAVPFPRVVAECGGDKACVEQRLFRTGALDGTFVGTKRVYPDAYATLYVSVGETDLGLDGDALVLRGVATSVRFLDVGGAYAMYVVPSFRPVVKRADGTLGVGVVGQAAHGFAAKSTGSPDELTLALVQRGDRLAAGEGSVRVRLSRPNGRVVDVTMSPTELAAYDYASSTAILDTVNKSTCCRKIRGQCSASDTQTYPLCCSGCVDALPTCAWRVLVDASVAQYSAPCCKSQSELLDVPTDYTVCRRSVDAASQYTACAPSAEHAFAFVPAGVWDLAPRGVTLPAYGRAFHMRMAAKGYRGVACRS